MVKDNSSLSAGEIRRDELFNNITYLQEPIEIGSYNYLQQEVVLQLKDSIPAEAQTLWIECFTRCGSEAPSRNFQTRVWVLDDSFKPSCHRTIFGARYSQQAISFSQVTLELPVSKERAIHVFSDDRQASNCHQTAFFVSAYMM